MSNVNIFEGFDYEPNDIDDEIFLSEIPLSLLKENIKTQFEDPMEYRKIDYVQSFLNKYQFSMENINDDDDQADLENIHVEFISFMRDMFRVYLGLGFPNLEDMDEESQEELIHFTYRYFIINIKKNFVNVILNSLNENKRSICDALPKKKDVTSLSLKRNVTDEDDLTIISNISDAIDMVLITSSSITKFLEQCSIDEPSLEAEYISDKYDSCDITGNFIEKYIDMLDDSFKVEIECKVRNKILKKYNKK